MTKKERELLQRAVRLIRQDDFEAGMQILLPLAGLRVPAWDAADKAETVTLTELVQREKDAPCDD